MMPRPRRSGMSPAAAGAALFAWTCLPAPALAAEPVVSTPGSLAQAGLGLFAVIALILGMAWLARRVGLVRHMQGGNMRVVSSTSLGTRQRLLLVEVEDTWLVLGVSAGEIRTLHTMPAKAPTDGDNIHGMPMGKSPSSMPDNGSFAQKLLRSMQESRKS